MKMNDLIQALKAQGIDATESQIEQAIGPTDYLSEDDIPSIVEMFQPVQGKPAKRKAGSIEKSDAVKSSNLAKLDQSGNLPQVAELTNTQVDAYIAEIEAMDRQGHVVSDELVAFLIDLYDRRDQAIQLADGAAARFREQDARLVQSMATLNTVLAGSVDQLKQAQNTMEQIAAGGARLGDNFRRGTDRWKSAAERFSSHVAGQSGSEAESAA